MLSTIPLWLHLLAATIWVGSQVMMFAVVVPSLRRISGAPRFEVLRSVTTRFGYLGFGALLLLLLTGIDNITRQSPDDMFDLRYGYVLTAKLVMVVLVVVLTAYHTLQLGPKHLALQTSAAASEAELKQYRVRSILVSVVTLLLSLAILFCAALLDTSFSYTPA